MQATLVACVLVTSSGLKITENANAGECQVTCKCSKSQFAWLFKRDGKNKQAVKQLEEAKTKLAEAQTALDEAEGKPTTSSAKGTQSVFTNILGVFKAKKSPTELKQEIDELQKTVQHLQETTHTDEGEEVADDTCCTSYANQHRDCVKEDAPAEPEAPAGSTIVTATMIIPETPDESFSVMAGN